MTTTQQYNPQDAADTDSATIEDKPETEAPKSQQPPQRSRKSPTAFRTISEVADELDVQQHVLRFWETKFSQVKPLKRGGGRRYYRPEDVALLKKIHHLLYTEGYTIKGVQKLLKGQGKQQILAEEQARVQEPVTIANESKPQPSSAETKGLSEKQRSILNAMLGDLKELRDMLKGEDS